jgi:hypothetical protein
MLCISESLGHINKLPARNIALFYFEVFVFSAVEATIAYVCICKYRSKLSASLCSFEFSLSYSVIFTGLYRSNILLHI